MAYNRKLLYTKSFPSWDTPSGILFTFYENDTAIDPVQLTATELNEPGSTITYAVTTGALPTGLTLSSSGEISGSPVGFSSEGSQSFEVTATDDEGETSVRSFSINWIIPIFLFESSTFTPGGATGYSGPSLSQAISGISSTIDDSWKNNTSYFNTSNGIQLFTVPATGLYNIEAWGAGATARNGGSGAKISGDFNLISGETIRILVGQKPYPFNSSAGGGAGGTFVTRSPHNTNESILVVAGGGGGGHNGSASNDEASIGTSGRDATTGQSGGANGNGGTSGAGGAGGGFFTNENSGYYGQAYVNGGLGSSRSGGNGGFGGGGGHGNSHGGGGGGYSGGGGSNGSPYHGGGGGSYNNGSNQVNQEVVSSADGKVIITRL